MEQKTGVSRPATVPNRVSGGHARQSRRKTAVSAASGRSQIGYTLPGVTAVECQTERILLAVSVAYHTGGRAAGRGIATNRRVALVGLGGRTGVIFHALSSIEFRLGSVPEEA